MIYSLDLMNITSSVCDLGFWTDLEPLLGIINACLPMLQPIFKAPFTRARAWIAAEGEKREILPGSDEAPLRPNDATVSTGSRLFRHLYGHLYPLSDAGQQGTSVSDSATRTLEDEAVWDGRSGQVMAGQGV